MSNQLINKWIQLSPSFTEQGFEKIMFREYAFRLSKTVACESKKDLDILLKEALSVLNENEYNLRLRAALYVLNDLAQQRWSIRVTEGGDVEVKRPDGDRHDHDQEKERIRKQELIKRDEQLREPATRKFITDLEKKVFYRGKFVSIFSLVRDGRELANSLCMAKSSSNSERVSALKKVIDPYIQFVDDTEYCDQTGLRLQDIWRYFRHTWINQYTNTPGRTMAFIVRDKAKMFHPVIGIGSIGSPIVQIRERDAWIGWNPDAFMECVSESPSIEFGLWLNKTVETAIGELFLEDFIEEQLIVPADVRFPTAKVINRLTVYGEKQRELHHRFARSKDLKFSLKRENTQNAVAHWRARSCTHLYKSKRALSLAEMLQSRILLQKYLSMPPSLEQIRNLVGREDGRRIIRKILRKAKADRVGIAMADITVCGAVAPYTHILGGKLISFLAASPRVITAYRKKYFLQESEIASSMAGRPIIRPSQLVLLGTTSLFGISSSQYNRLRMPTVRLGGKSGEFLEYIALGKSEAYGTSHFSSKTVETLVSLVQQLNNGQRVNSIFGEGVSPKLRKIRQGLEALRLPADALLQHGRERIVYGIPLVRNLREFLLGMDDKPEYIFDMTDSSGKVEEVTQWWMERWLSKRIESNDVLSKVAQHTLIQPIRHGARVTLPKIDDNQLSLFDDIFH